MTEHRLILFRIKDKHVHLQWNEQHFLNAEIANPIYVVGYAHDGITFSVVREVLLTTVDKNGVFVGNREWVDDLRRKVEPKLPKTGIDGVKLVTIRRIPGNIWENVDLVESMNNNIQYLNDQ